MSWIAYLLTILAGASNPLQSGTNAELHKKLQEPVWTCLVVYVTGLVGSLLLLLILREAVPDRARLVQAPWWAWLGGLISIGPTMAGLALAQKMGSGVFTSLTITAGIATSVIIDNFGWIGFKQHPVSLGRVIGCILMIGGVWLLSRF